MPKKHIANHLAEWMKRIEETLEHKMDKTEGEDLKERVSDLESNHEELESQLEDLEELDSKHEELSEKVEVLRVSWRMRTPASMISRAKPFSLKNYRRTGRGLSSTSQERGLSRNR